MSIATSQKKSVKDRRGRSLDRIQRFKMKSEYNSDFIEDISSISSQEQPTLSLKSKNVVGIHGDRIMSKEEYKEKKRLKHMEYLIAQGANPDLLEKELGPEYSKRTLDLKTKRSKTSKKSKSQVQQSEFNLMSEKKSQVSATQAKRDKKKFLEDIAYLDNKLKPKY